MKRKIKNKVIIIILSIFALFQLYPLIWLVLFSLKSNNEIFGENILGFPKELIWSNYSRALFSGHVATYFINSVIVTFLTIVISNILAAMVAYALTRMRWKLKAAFGIYFTLGMMIPIHAALLPIFLVLSNLNLLNTYSSLVLPYVAFALPMSILILSGFMSAIPKEMEEAASIDGCNVFQIFFKIILPTVAPAISTISIFTYLSSWNELMFSATFITKQEFRTLPVGIMSMVGQYVTDWGPIGAGLVIATIPTLIIYILMSEQVQKGLTSGGVKE